MYRFVSVSSEHLYRVFLFLNGQRIMMQNIEDVIGRGERLDCAFSISVVDSSDKRCHQKQGISRWRRDHT
jgi:hypothetical protein